MIRAAVIGTGFIGAVHAEAIRRCAGAELAGVLGSSPSRGALGAERIGTRSYESLDALLADQVDVVHVTSPNQFHAEQSIAALRAGKHVVCEKPLATDLAAAREMAMIARDSGLVNATCFNYRCYPQIRQARAKVTGDEIGAPHLVTGGYLQDWLLYATDWNWRIDEASGGATRAVSDIGSHWLDAVQYVTGSQVTSVMADLNTVHPVRHRPVGEVETFSGGDSTAETRDVDVHTDDAASVLVRFDNGARGCFTVSQVSAGRKNSMSFEIAGADAALAWTMERPDELWIGHRDRPNELYWRDPGSLADEAAPTSQYPGGHYEGFGDAFAAMVRLIYADVEGGKPAATPAYATFADGLRGLQIENAIRLSNEQQRWADVATD